MTPAHTDPPTQVEPSPPTAPEAGADLERRVTEVGLALRASLDALLDSLGGATRRPQALADRLGVDKVLTSRLLKALDARDPIAVVHYAPGPAPLARVLAGARREGAATLALAAAEAAIADFERLIKVEVGDRGYLDSILSAWLPEARRENELRSKQTAWRAMSQLRGVSADVDFTTVLLHPNDDGEHIDVIWLIGMLGLRRLRPGARARFATRRNVGGSGGDRRPRTLDGDPVDAAQVQSLRLDQFCHAPPAPLDVVTAGEVVHYSLGGRAFGPESAVDLVFAEANFAELPRTVPTGSGRRGYVFAECTTPSRVLSFDVLVHADLYPDQAPRLDIYDTAGEGVASPNSPERDADRLDLAEQVEELGQGLDRVRARDIPDYAGLLRHVFARTGWDAAQFRGYRVRVDYPVYGSQVTLSFAAPEGDAAK
ncbi:hypothetical protein [Engelhardtia mirabilis]|uniref:Uncharacterized protein n=1 Tax=Engelhardtia mirabilis TaxID=2528011 RepID=A0A518BG19_9BACT|nr:hypothetical protein Pla133_09980 [Planctomycetes bacterium Pla133]QDV00258.1 hypothetical protein Pla86_09970 [Planctomycetes bacterium Pla86]